MRESLERVLESIPDAAVAMSGGVDSVTLGALASLLRPDTEIYHAVSPAVPPEATRRVERLSAARGWRLTVIRSGEFDDPNYRANPADRCFHCKTNLYETIRTRTPRQILSGANIDDLGEYRPGLEAASRHGVRHPFIEAGLRKAAVRRLALQLELPDIAALPSSPCLASRVETGIRIEAELLAFIHDVERRIAATHRPRTVRCRVRAAAVVVELDADALGALSASERDAIAAELRVARHAPAHLPVHFQEYRNGSAFLVGHSA